MLEVFTERGFSMKIYGWAMKNIHEGGEEGFYVGFYLTREDAILDHCPDMKKSWDICKKRGDRVVRVCMKEMKSKKGVR
jgi:hypothetical protein